MSDPTVSFIVLSYNYERLIENTIHSILAQTFTDFELIVIDDCSTDNSRSVIASFEDPRLRLIVNDTNLGGAGSYNRAYEVARGRFISSVDADDWITPEKTRLQLAAIEADPRVQIVGSWISIIDQNGDRHPSADTIESDTNRDHDFNLLETWCVKNLLCRSSTLIDRRLHDACGLLDSDMIRAPDFELWTRALRAGVRFKLVQEKLTYYRLHDRGVTHADPLGSLVEIAYLISRNIVPTLQDRSLLPTLTRVADWLLGHPAFPRIPPRQRSRLLSALFQIERFSSFKEFRHWLTDEQTNLAAERVGSNIMAALSFPTAIDLMEELRQYNRDLDKARNEWFIPRMAQLEQMIREYEFTRRDWFIPRLTILENEISERDRIKEEWFLPKIADLERAVEEFELLKRDWFIPRIAALEKEVSERDQIAQERLFPKIAELERELAKRKIDG